MIDTIRRTLCCSLLAVQTIYCCTAATPARAAEDAASPKSATPTTRAPEKIERDTPPKITREERLIEGWRVRIDLRLLGGEHAELGRRAQRLLGDKLYEIAAICPAQQLEQLRAVVIVVDLDHGKLTSMQYHPGAGWLREHGYDPALVKAFHIPSVTRFVDLHHQRVQPRCVLHELAHAFHDQILSFDHAEVRAAYEAAKAGGGYDKVLHIMGHTTEHYARKNHHEYFAECSEAYFGANDFYPFVRGELKQHDPRMFALLEKLWGKLP